MKLSKNGYKLLKEFEGLKLKPYLCSAKVPTIGYGNTFYENGRKVTLKDPAITEERADQLLKFIVGFFEKDLNSLVKGVTLTQNQFDALLLLGYNIGMDIDVDDIPEGLGDSRLMKKVKANPNDPTIASEFMKWVNSGGKPVQGLINRRKKEAALYFTK